MNLKHTLSILSAAGLFLCCAFTGLHAGDPFGRQWIYASETSAVLYWQLDDISAAATGCVEFGDTDTLGQSTPLSAEPRWSQFHRLVGLSPGGTYYYRLVSYDGATNRRAESPVYKFTLRSREGLVRVPEEVSGPPYALDRPGASYILTRDITTPATAFEISAPGVSLDLDGHTVTFGDDTDKQAFGVSFTGRGPAELCNGRIVQGRWSGDYSAAVRSAGRPFPTGIFGIETDVHLKCAYPVNFLSRAAGVDIHHNNFYSRVTELESRHYPGNALLQISIGDPGNVHIHDNLFTEGCHCGVLMREGGPNVELDHNDIRHHQQYVNGYAISPCAGADVHHNKITSTGRAMHLTRGDIRVHDNWIDTRGHMHLSDLPAGTRPFHHRMIELHGLKFEGGQVRNCKVYNNFVRIVQEPPRDSDGRGDPRDKRINGVYVRSAASEISKKALTDAGANWEKDRWRLYWVKYAPDLPPVQITGNDSHNLYADFQKVGPGEYTIYMKWRFVPPTPLNIACEDPNAMNEVYGNTFTGLTTYKQNRHGDYGDSGEWATAVMFVSTTHGPADPGKYSAYVHDNTFVSNDLFLNSYEPVNQTVPMKNNTFVLVREPLLTDREDRMRNVGYDYEKMVRETGNNRFTGCLPDTLR